MNKIEENATLLLTASIKPARGLHSLPKDPNEREDIYLDVLGYYAFKQNRIKHIVFIESSAATLNKFYELAKKAKDNKNIEIISLDQNSYFPKSQKRILSTCLKGYLEVMLIKNGIDKSSLLRKSEYIAKVTGRIKLLNLSEILECSQEPFDFLCDYKDHGYLIKRLLGNKTAASYCDSRFFIAKVASLYECLNYLCKSCPADGFVLEKALYDYLNKRSSSLKIIKRLPLEPIFVGKKGHFKGEDYNSITTNIARKARSISRILMPWFHV